MGQNHIYGKNKMTNTETNILWEGKGKLFDNLSIYAHGDHFVGKLTNSKTFLADKDMTFETGITIEEAVTLIHSEDEQYYDLFTMYADEG